mgnify:FL=1
MLEKWVTVAEAAKLVDRSPATIYTWIDRTKRGIAKPPLRMKEMVLSDSHYGGGSGWQVGTRSLFRVSESAPRATRPAGEKLAHSVFSGGDSWGLVRADRRKWVQEWVERGKTLPKVLAIFSSDLHDEIEWYYQQAMQEKEKRPGEGDDPAR